MKTFKNLYTPQEDLTLSDFDYPLVQELIAAYPANPRDTAKLLVWEEDKPSVLSIFKELDSFLEEGDLLVLNNSKVIPARLHATRPRLDEPGEVLFEILLHRPLQSFTTWEAFVKPAKRLKVGQILTFSPSIQAEVIHRENEFAYLTFRCTTEEFETFLEECGEMPLPPYIQRDEEGLDKEEYQTVYADPAGSVAAPTAGLHFTEELLEKLKHKGVNIAYVTLHVGAGTFQPVSHENLDEHTMHQEWGSLSQNVAAQINHTKASGKRVIAVGTTSLRVLESAAQAMPEEDKPLSSWEGETDIFIRPGYQFKVVDRLITNFHLPKSTLLMLVAAFIGYDEMKNLYTYALNEKLRFFSYGDACLLTRKEGKN